MFFELCNRTKYSDIESFEFENNYDSDSEQLFSFSSHFKEINFQISSIDYNLPEEGSKKLNTRNKKAIKSLYKYITDHFNETQCSYIEVLFCLNGYENEEIQELKIINIKSLESTDLFYKELKLIKITR
ncbi:hypothetical protein IT72_14010 [Listeria monocytogenes]|nr:hypothetical protein [Listeria monocytogenes]